MTLLMAEKPMMAPQIAARASHDLPEAPLSMPEQDLRPAGHSKAAGWLAQVMRGLRPQGTARS